MRHVDITGNDVGVYRRFAEQERVIWNRRYGQVGHRWSALRWRTVEEEHYGIERVGRRALRNGDGARKTEVYQIG